MRGAGWGRPSGKSTLMNIIAAWTWPTSGDYLFCGREVGRLDDDELSRIKRVGSGVPELQSSAEIDRGGNVELPLVYAGVSRRERHDRAMELLGRRALWIARHRPAELSGGQKQRCRRTGTGQRPVPDSGGRADRQSGQRSGAQIRISC